MTRFHHIRAYIFLAATVLLWGMPPLFIKYLVNAGFSSHTMNFYRYSSAVGVMVLIVLLRYRHAFRWSWGLAGTFAIIAIPNVLYQTSFVEGLQVLDPGFTALLMQLAAPMSVLLAWFLFHDERSHIRSGRFVAGLILSLVGATGIVAFNRRYNFEIVKAESVQLATPSLVAFSIMLIVFAALFWALYTVAMRHYLKREHPVICFTGMALMGMFFFLPMAWAEGNLDRVTEVDWGVNVILALSGILFLALAQVLYFESVRVLGVSAPAISLLLCPLIANLLSFYIFDEMLTMGQWIAGLALIAGAGLSVQSRYADIKRAQKEASALAEAPSRSQ